MHDTGTIEAINREQLVTATDRLLIRGGRPAKYGPTVPSAAFAYDWQSSTERTIVDRRDRQAPKRARGGRSPVFAISLALPSLFGIGLGIAALL
jgi:hypothetical protein